MIYTLFFLILKMALGNATRCEYAAILKRFIDKYELR